MRRISRENIWLLLASVIIALLVTNIFITYKKPDRDDIDKYITAYDKTVDSKIAYNYELLRSRQDTIRNLGGPKGDKGEPGDSIKGDPGTTTIVHHYEVPSFTQPRDGTDGIAGREIELAKDEDGLLMWRYVGASLWSYVEEVSP